MNDYQPGANPYGPDREGPSDSQGCRNWMIGCGVASVIVVGLLIVGGYLFVGRAKQFLANTGLDAAKQGIEQADLPDAQKQAIIARIDEFGDDFRAGKITIAEAVEIGQKIVTSRAIVAGGIEYLLRTQVLGKAPMTDDQRAEVERLTQRLARGMIEEKLDGEDFVPLRDILMEEKDENQWELKEDIGETEIAAFIEAATTLVDDAEIPDEPYEVDIAGELDRILDEY